MQPRADRSIVPMRAIYVPISSEDFAILRRQAFAERRRPQDQAAVLIAEGLRRRRPRPVAVPQNAGER